jgi:murein DD-endopeptidase MepM/ murein hydrolase activator NlpD
LRLDESGLNVLVVRGDGGLVRWISLPRRLAATLLVLGALGVTANAAALLHYVSLYREHASLVATNDYLARHASTLPATRRRLLEVRDEMRAWEALHVEVWKPLGGQPGAAAAGIGGPRRATSIDGKALDDIDVLVAHVREESQRLRALAHATRETGGLLAALPSRLPLRAALTSPFGPRLSPWTGEPEFHAGVDLAADPGTPVRATAAGVVRFAGTTDGYGKSILLDHGAGIESRYGHLQNIGVAQGQRVERGQLIGLTGNTGRSTGPHLHYEVLVDGRPVDPRRLARG